MKNERAMEGDGMIMNAKMRGNERGIFEECGCRAAVTLEGARDALKGAEEKKDRRKVYVSSSTWLTPNSGHQKSENLQMAAHLCHTYAR